MNNKSSNLLYWNRQNVERMINLLQSQRCLWDIKTPEYKERKSREEALNFICQGIKPHIHNITKEDIRSKIAVLRSQFRKQLRQMNDDSTQVKKPSLWCYKLLFFLKPNVEIRDTDGFKGDDISPPQDSDGDGEEDNQEDSTATKHWDRGSTERLIELLHEHRCLWDTNMAKAAKYGFRTVRDKALNQLCQDLQRKYGMENITVDDVRKKVFGLRSQYRKEIRKMEVSRRRGAKTIQPPALWCFEQLSFMRPFVEIRIDVMDLCADVIGIDKIKTERVSPLPESNRELDFKSHNQEPLSSSEFETTPPKQTDDINSSSKNISWDRQSTEKLIKLFREQRSLWDANMDQYRYKSQRDKSLNLISEKLQSEGKNVTAIDVRKKIFVLRSQFRKQVRQLKLSKLSTGEMKRPSLWCYKLLHFLRAVTAPVKDLRNEAEMENKHQSEDPLSFSESHVEITPSTQEDLYATSDEELHITPTIEDEFLDSPPPIEDDLLRNDDQYSDVRPSGQEENISPIATTSSKIEKNKNSSMDIEEHLKELKKLLKRPKRKFDFLAEQVSATLEEIDNEEIADYTVGAIQRLLLEAKAKRYRQTNETELQNDEEFFLA